MSNMRIVAARAAILACVMGAGSAYAIELPAGDWTFTVNGNVNVHYIYSRCEAADRAVPIVTVGGACVQGAGDQDNSSISNGLLPAALVFGASTTQQGYELSVNFGLYPGISTNDGGSPNLQNGASNTALGTTGLDVRQVFVTIGNERIGQLMLGRNFGLFGFDAIINDMSLPGVGVGGAMSSGAPANTSLGGIGFGYIYTDTLAQMNYTTPVWAGLSLTAGIFDPIEPILADTPSSKATPGLHAKLAYDHAFGDNKLFVWSSVLHQQQRDVGGSGNDYDSTGVDLGARFDIARLQLMVYYYYSASGVGTTGLFVLSDDGAGHARDSDGWLMQGTVQVGDTKFGANYGVSRLDHANAADASAVPNLLESNRKFTLGIYHALTANLTLLTEYSDVRTEAHNGGDNRSANFNIGAYVSF